MYQKFPPLIGGQWAEVWNEAAWKASEQSRDRPLKII